MIRKPITLLLILLLSFPFISTSQFVWAQENTWQTVASMPTARSGLGVAVVDGMVYAMGGSNGLGRLGNNEVYDPTVDEWATRNPIPTPRSGFGMAVYQDRIYAIGGWGYSGVIGRNEVYDPVSNTWETKTQMPTARTDVLANQVNGKIFVVAGKNFTDYAWPVLCNQTEIYNPLSDSWITGSPMPDFQGIGPEIASKSENVASAVLDNKVYVVVDKTLHIYDTEANVWSYGADLPSSPKGPSACATTGSFAPKRLHVLGLGSHYIYDSNTDEWTSATPIPDSRYWVKLGVVADILYAIGGGNDVGEYGYESVNYNEQYIPVGYIPEFSSWIILPIIMIATFLVAMIYRRRVVK